MNAFKAACKVEQRSMEILRPFIRARSHEGQFVVTAKGPLARHLQETVGDILYNTDAETVYSADIKAEQTRKHGNFFFETWSNRERFTVGWMFKLNTDLLLCHFLDEDELYPIPFRRLRKWAFHEGSIYKYPEKQQRKREQRNDTWGRCVPIAVVMRDLRLAPPFSPAAYFASPPLPPASESEYDDDTPPV